MQLDPSLGFVAAHMHPLFDAIAFADEQGFDHLEVKMNGEADRETFEREHDRLRRELDETGLDLLVHLPYQLDIGSPYEHVREGSCREIEACLEQAAALGAEKAVIHAESRTWLGDGLRDNVFNSLRRLDEVAADLDIELCAENPLRGTVPIDEFEDLFDATDLSMTLDTGHARCDGLSSTEIADFVTEHGNRISHMHLNDTQGESDDHLPFGEGTVDFRAIFAALPDGWDDTLSLEIKDDFASIRESKPRLERALAE